MPYDNTMSRSQRKRMVKRDQNLQRIGSQRNVKDQSRHLRRNKDKYSPKEFRKLNRKLKRNKRSSGFFAKLRFTFVRSSISTILFLILWFAYMIDLPRLPLFSEQSWMTFGIITLIVLGIRMFSYIGAYIWTRYSSMEGNAQYFLRAMIITVITSIFIFAEVFIFLERELGMWWSMGLFVVLQFLIFFMSDAWADKILFQH